jgi:DNA repair exonuclease SbcCD ATPase subunit
MTTFTPYEICIRNFMSFGNNETRIRLDFNNPTLIVGQNHDSAVDGQLDSNGAGKTTISNAINYVLYGDIISDKPVNADDLINNINKKDLYVAIKFTTGGDRFYKVERYRKNKAVGGTGVRIYERIGGTPDDEFTKDHDVTPDSTANADVMITQITGMVFEVFSRIVAFSATHKPFLSLPAGEQTEIIEEICGLRELSEKAETLKKRSKVDKQELERLVEINSTIKTQRAQIIGQIASAKAKMEQWDSDNSSDLRDLRDELSELTSSGIDYNEQIALLELVQESSTKIAEFEATKRELLSERRTFESDIQRSDAWLISQTEKLHNAGKAVENFKTIPADEIIQDIHVLTTKKQALQEMKSRLSVLTTEKAGYDKVLTEKKKELAHLHDATCPYCTQQFKDAKGKVVEVESLIEITQKKVDKVQVEIDSIDLNMLGYVEDITKLEAKWTFKTEREVMEYQSGYDTLVRRLEQLNTETNPYPVDKAEALAEMEAIDSDVKKLDNMITKRLTKKAAAQEELKFATMKEVMSHQNRIESVRADIDRLSKATNPLSSTVAELESIKLEATKDDEIATLETTIEHQAFLVKLLTKKDSFIRKLLLQKSLPFLNTRLRYYLDRIGFLHRVVFQEDLSVKISQFGNAIGFGNLSSGQKARINLALSFSFRDMLQARHGKLMFCILDECLDVGLGNVGVQLAAKMIKSVATDEKLSMFIISHRDEISNMFDSKLVVSLKSGFSTVESQ